jgi:hypothetical protein
MSRKGIPNAPRQQMLSELRDRYPKLNLMAEMVDLAMMAKKDVEKRQEWMEDPKKADGPFEPVTNAELSTVQQMFERPAKYLLPQLKAIDMSVGGLEGAGPITVSFARGEPDKAPE